MERSRNVLGEAQGETGKPRGRPRRRKAGGKKGPTLGVRVKVRGFKVLGEKVLASGLNVDDLRGSRDCT